MTKPIELSADEVKKAGSVEAAVRIRTATEKRAEALARDHTNSTVIRVIGKPPSINELNGGKLKNRIAVKAEYQQRCEDGWVRAGKPVVPMPFKLTVKMLVCGTDFDPSNLYQGAAKCFLDAMQNVCCIEQDNWKAHKGPDKYSWENASHDLVEFTLTYIGKRKF